MTELTNSKIKLFDAAGNQRSELVERAVKNT